MKIKIAVIATGSNGNAYIINAGDITLLLDAGVPVDIIRKTNRYRLSNITAALITHSHNDHAQAVSELLRECVAVYHHPNSGIIVEEALRHALIPLTSLRKLREGISVSPAQQHHDTPCVGWDILLWDRKLVIHYITDTVSINVPHTTFPAGWKQLYICECNYTSERINYVDNTESSIVIKRNMRTRKTHLSDKTVIDYFAPGVADAILFVHQSKLNFDESEFRNKFISDIPYEVAKTGKIYEYNINDNELRITE